MTSKVTTLGLVQMSMVSDETRNLEKALKMVQEASRKGANVVCLPELFTSLYFPQEEKAETLAEKIPGRTSSLLSTSAKENHVVLVAGSIYEKDGSKNFNTTLVFDEKGKIIGKYRKIHIPQDPSFYEQNYFDSGEKYGVFDTRYGKIGTLICFDQWYPEAARVNRLMGADIIFYPTAIGRVRGIEQTEGNWQKAWEQVQVGHAIANSVIVAAVNRVGREKEMVFWGGSFVSDQFGKILFRAGENEGVFTVPIDLSLGKEIEGGWGFLRNRRPATYKPITGASN